MDDPTTSPPQEPSKLPWTAMDAQLAQLQRDFPGWLVWFVPHAVTSTATWCARPEPLLSCDSAASLAEAIRSAEAAAGDD